MVNNWSHVVETLEDLYAERKIHSERLMDDAEQLRKAYIGIETLWFKQYEKINKMKYVLFSEAPLWGDRKKYFYNELSPPSQFFYCSDLNSICHCDNKKELIECFNFLGIIILDILPFAFNDKTALNYSGKSNGSEKITAREYKDLLIKTSDHHLKSKLNLILNKSGNNLSFFYRYKRVNKLKTTLDDLFKRFGIKHFISSSVCISQRGGGVDRHKLKQLLRR